MLTSRNFGLSLRRAISSRNPDILKSNGGGANAILVRGAIEEHRTERLTWRPERRCAHGVRLARRAWVVNVHASTHREAWARRDTLRALARVPREPLLFGGDVNLRGKPELPGPAARRRQPRRPPLHPRNAARRRSRCSTAGRLSDHPPVRVTL